MRAALAPLIEGLAAGGRYQTRLAVHEGEHIRLLSAEEVDWIGIEDEQVLEFIPQVTNHYYKATGIDPQVYPGIAADGTGVLPF